MKNPGIYVLTSSSSKQYVGKDRNLPSRIKQHLKEKRSNCRLIHRAIQKYGQDTFSVEIIRYPGISEDALDAVERWWIKRLQTLAPAGYNLTEGGEGGKLSDETRQKMSEHAHRRVAEGTHNFLGGEIPKRAQKRLVENGTHHFINGEVSRQSNKKRLEDGTHHLLGDKNPVHKRIKDGTHHFFGGDIARRTQRRLVENGTHHLLDGEVSRRTQKKRVEDGTHNFLGDSNPNKKQMKDGTHHFIGDSNPMKRLAKEGRHPSTLKRLKAEWCYIIALSRFWYEIHDYTLKRRAEFLSKEILDLSNAEQTYLF